MSASHVAAIQRFFLFFKYKPPQVNVQFSLSYLAFDLDANRLRACLSSLAA